MAGDSKTEKATAKKRRDERKKGHVFLSQDAVAVATLLGGILMLRFTFKSSVAAIRNVFYFCLDSVKTPQSLLDHLGDVFWQVITASAKAVSPLLLATVFFAVSATFAQTRFLVSAELIKPKFDRISPRQGIRRLFSLRSAIDALKGLLKIAVLLYIIYSCLSALIHVSINYLYMDISESCWHLLSAIFSMMVKVAIAFLVLAALDFLYQWWEYERQMKMSKQEVKEEYKQTEGNPQIKGKIREIQRKMSQARMMQQVPKADIIVRNPTHYAVALRYKLNVDRAPVVLAKGQDELAMRIVKTAEEFGIATIENVPLAHALYEKVNVNSEIPPELYSAVAEVLVYLYKLDSTKD